MPNKKEALLLLSGKILIFRAREVVYCVGQRRAMSVG